MSAFQSIFAMSIQLKEGRNVADQGIDDTSMRRSVMSYLMSLIMNTWPEIVWTNTL